MSSLRASLNRALVCFEACMDFGISTPSLAMSDATSSGMPTKLPSEVGSPGGGTDAGWRNRLAALWKRVKPCLDGAAVTAVPALFSLFVLELFSIS